MQIPLLLREKRLKRGKQEDTGDGKADAAFSLVSGGGSIQLATEACIQMLPTSQERKAVCFLRGALLSRLSLGRRQRQSCLQQPLWPLQGLSVLKTILKGTIMPAGQGQGAKRPEARMPGLRGHHLEKVLSHWQRAWPPAPLSPQASRCDKKRN